MSMAYLERTARPSTSIATRLFHSMWRQSALTPSCPLQPRLENKLTLVTGGNAGIGYEIARGLARRGAEVIIAARNQITAQRAASTIKTETGAQVHALFLDLGDLSTLSPFFTGLDGVRNGREITILIQNAGIWPQQYARSPQGHEIAFATNVLGHFSLTQRLITQGLAATARVVVQTGDIYVIAKDCTADYRYRGAYGGMLAYCRSKLGNLWYAQELQRRNPTLEVAIGHPGVIASGLVTVGGGIGAMIKRRILMTPEQGAQTALVLATQPGVGDAAYYHNALGRMVLAVDDPASSVSRAAQFWDLLERLGAH
jgi:retinol dehydrogenase 12